MKIYQEVNNKEVRIEQDFFLLILADKLANCIRKALGLSNREKLGRIDSFRKEADIIGIIVALPRIKALLALIVDDSLFAFALLEPVFRFLNIYSVFKNTNLFVSDRIWD